MDELIYYEYVLKVPKTRISFFFALLTTIFFMKQMQPKLQVKRSY